jgi:hypothetical protein
MMQKICAIDPMGLLGDSGEIGENGDPDQDMQETHSHGSEEMEEADDNPAIHKNIHVVSASEEEVSEGEKDERTTEVATAGNAAGAGSACTTSAGPAHVKPAGSEMNTAPAHAGVCNSKEKSFIIVDIQKKLMNRSLQALLLLTLPKSLVPG